MCPAFGLPQSSGLLRERLVKTRSESAFHLKPIERVPLTAYHLNNETD